MMNSDDLKSNITDYVVSVAKVALSAVPVVGPALVEIIGTVIPQQINDVEVIVLRSYLVRELGGDTEFRERHAAVLASIGAHLQSDQHDIDKSVLYDGYRLHLVQPYSSRAFTPSYNWFISRLV